MKILKNVTYIDLGWLDNHLYYTFTKWLKKQNIEYTIIHTERNMTINVQYYIKLIFKDDIDIERVTSWLKEIGIEEENAL